MEFKSEELKTSFSIPDPVTVAVHDAYEARRMEVADMASRGSIAPRFLGALAIADGWKSEVLPDPLPTIAATGELHGDQLKVVHWAGMRVHLHMTSLLMIPKASFGGLFSALSPGGEETGK